MFLPAQRALKGAGNWDKRKKEREIGEEGPLLLFALCYFRKCSSHVVHATEIAGVE